VGSGGTVMVYLVQLGSATLGSWGARLLLTPCSLFALYCVGRRRAQSLRCCLVQCWGPGWPPWAPGWCSVGSVGPVWGAELASTSKELIC